MSWEFVIEEKSRSSIWDPLIPPFVKINFDVVINEENPCLAMLCKNHNKELLFARTELIEDQGPLKASINKKAEDFGFKHVICEGDTLNVILPYKTHHHANFG